jgi:hypothetical protein
MAHKALQALKAQPVLKVPQEHKASRVLTELKEQLVLTEHKVLQVPMVPL